MSNARTIVFTNTYSGPFTISADDNALKISLIVLTGTCTIQGNAKFQGGASGTVSLSAGQTWELSALGPNAPLDGLTITPTGGGTVGVMILL